MITETDLKQLNQLDRIEYRQKKEEINIRTNSNFVFKTIELFSLLFILLFCIDVLFKGVISLSSFTFLLQVGVIVSTFALMIDLINSIFKDYYLKNLNKEYFELKPRWKKK
jgi:hypothetical protein